MNVLDYFAGIAEELGVYALSPQTPLPPAGEGFTGTDSEATSSNKNNTTTPSPAGGRGTSRQPSGPGEGGPRSKGKTTSTTLTAVLFTIITVWFLTAPSLSSAQDFSQTIKRTIQFADAGNPENELAVYNINGSVTIEGYGGDVVQVIAHQELEGTGQEIKQARKDLELVVRRQGNRVLVYLDAPFIEIREENGHISYRIDRWDDDSYEFLYDITIRMPRSAHVRASTINRGSVSVKNTLGSVSASNINGELELTGISGPTKARTINGDITIRYRQNPAEDSEYQTINGTIDVSCPEDLSADIRFKSLHGDLYTDFPNVERLQALVKQDKRQSRGGVTYRIDKFAPIRIGDGGPVLSFQVLNGDVYVRRIES